MTTTMMTGSGMKLPTKKKKRNRWSTHNFLGTLNSSQLNNVSMWCVKCRWIVVFFVVWINFSWLFIGAGHDWRADYKIYCFPCLSQGFNVSVVNNSQAQTGHVYLMVPGCFRNENYKFTKHLDCSMMSISCCKTLMNSVNKR